MKLIKSLVILSLLLAVPAWADQGQNMQFVRILPQVEVDQPLINLLHLADQSKPMGQELKELLSLTTVGVAPEQGKSFTIAGTELRRLIDEANLPQDVSILLPDKVRVTTASTLLSRMELMNIYEQALQQEVADKGLELVILDVNTGQDINLPSSQYTYNARRLGSKWGRVTVMVDFYVNGHRVAQTRLQGNVDVYGQALVAARSLPAGYVLTAQDITSARVNMSDTGFAAVSDPAMVVGQRLRAPIGMGGLLDPRRMQQELLVRPGDVVNMICSNPNISLSTKGRVEQSGYLNSTVKLTNLASKRQVFGRVLDSGTVMVDF